MIYTGIGPRNATQRVLEICREIGTAMAHRDWVLRTGAGEDGVSNGCDLAFRTGCELALPHSLINSSPLLEIYCPMDGVSESCQPQWFKSNNVKRFYAGSDVLAKALVRALHIKGKGLAPGHLELHARNVHQQLGMFGIGGAEGYVRSNLVILWSPNGEATRGGTGMSQKIYDILPGRCSQFNIGMFDLDNPVDVESMWAQLRLIVQSLEMEKK